MRSNLATLFIALAIMGMSATTPMHAAPKDEIRATFTKFVDAQNAHDLKAMEDVLSDSPDFLWTSPGHVVRSREAALARFLELFQGTWQVDPDWSTFQTLRLNISTVEVFARAAISSGAAPRAVRMNVILVNTERGWRVLTILASDLPPA